MTDTRLATVFEDVETMLSVVDVDEVGDIETLLMFLFARPVQVGEVWDDKAGATALEVLIAGNDESVESAYEFPLRMMDLAHACAEMVEVLGAYTRDGTRLGGGGARRLVHGRDRAHHGLAAGPRPGPLLQHDGRRHRTIGHDRRMDGVTLSCELPLTRNDISCDLALT